MTVDCPNSCNVSAQDLRLLDPQAVADKLLVMVQDRLQLVHILRARLQLLLQPAVELCQVPAESRFDAGSEKCAAGNAVFYASVTATTSAPRLDRGVAHFIA